MLKIIVDIVVP